MILIHSSPTSEPMKELLTPSGGHHGIGDGEGLVMTKIPLFGAPNGLQIWLPDEEQEVAAAPYREM